MSFRQAVDQTLPAPLRHSKAKAGRFFRYLIGRFVPLSERPAFVLGNQKSGTTVIGAALAHGADVSVTLDIRDIRADLLFGLYDDSISLQSFIDRYRRSFSRRIIKEPGLTFVFDKLRREFSNATFIFITRDPRDNIRSILDRLGLSGSASSLSPDACSNLHPIWREVIENKWIGIEAEHYIESLAHRWNRAADIYLQNQDQVHLVRYEDFCEDKVAYTRRLVRRTGFKIKQPVESVVDTQFQSRGNRGVSWTEFFGPDNLSRIEQICKNNMEGLGYAESI